MLWTSKAVIRPSLSWSIKIKAVRNSKFSNESNCNQTSCQRPRKEWIISKIQTIPSISDCDGTRFMADKQRTHGYRENRIKRSSLRETEREKSLTGERGGHGPTATKNTEKTRETRDVFHFFLTRRGRGIYCTHTHTRMRANRRRKKRTASNGRPLYVFGHRK
jgi:hypothetical protein